MFPSDDAVREMMIRSEFNDSKSTRSDWGWVYLIRSGNRIKIGKSGDPVSRFRTYRTHCPDVELLAMLSTNNAGEIERSLHRLYKSVGIEFSGEWMTLPSTAWLEELVGMMSSTATAG